MRRADYAYKPLADTDYEAIIAAMEVFKDASGNRIISPLHGHDNWASAESEARAGDVDLRALLAALLLEDHGGTDPGGGVALAKVFNFGGIKWVGQAGAYDSGIQVPPNEQPGTYAGFRDFGAFIVALVATLNNIYCGPAFQSGDLAGAWAIYVGGPNNPNHAAGQARVDQWQYYLAQYPPGGNVPTPTPAPDPQGVYGEDIVAVLRPHLGEDASDGSLDPWNPAGHQWAGWCEASTEGAQYAAGLHDVVHRASAAAKLDAVSAQGLLQTSWPPSTRDLPVGTLV